VFPNGDVYSGSYASGKRAGHGFYKWKQGHRYVGDYQENQRNGKGYMIYPDGTKYKGTLSLESPKKLIFDA
jgi:radial spoke head protein 1